VTHERHGLFRRERIFNERQRVAIIRQVPERAMAPWEKHAVIVRLLDFGQLYCVGERLFCGRVLFKAARVVSLEIWLVAFWIERRLAALRRGERDVDPGVTEYEIGRSEFLEPEPRLSAGVSKLIM
jgi:hypothetical protein